MPPLSFHFGLSGALGPFALFFAGAVWLGWSQAPDERGFWPLLVAALGLGLVLARDRRRFSEILLEGMARPVVMLMVMAWLCAGVLSTLLGASGFVEGLVWAAHRAHLSGGSYVAAAFLTCCLVSTSTGTSFGTLLICGPLLYPAGAAVEAEPAVLIGAILGGATFGDSISPISDTTIASAGTQGADIGGVVKARLKYVLPAAGVAFLAALLYGGAAGPGAVTAPAGPAVPAVPAGPVIMGSPRALPMVIVPLAVIGLLLARRHLIEGLLGGILLAALAGLGLGLITPGQLLRIEPGQFAAKSLVIDGIERGVGVSIFTLLLVGLVATLEATGLMRRLVELARGRARSARGAEVWIVMVVTAVVMLTTHSVVAILAVGEFTKETGERFGLGAYRRANLLDVTVCTWPFLLPYFLPTLLAASATASGAASGMPQVSPLAAGLHNVYSWGLLGVVLVAVVAGYGRREGSSPASLPQGPGESKGL